MSCPTVGIATDGSHSILNRLTRYKADDIATSEELFIGHLGGQTIINRWYRT